MQRPSKLRVEHLQNLKPLTKNQERVFDSYKEKYNLVLSGAAGTGKTFLALYLGLKDVLTKGNSLEKVVLIRSALPTRDMGFLPGEKEEKEAAYMDPYISTVNELFQDKEAWKKMIQFNNIEFMTTSFIRGITLNDSVVIVDEAQNCNFHELCSIITRIGKNCKVILCGDYYQSDFVKQNDKSGLYAFINILNNMKSFDHIEFEWKDIVRSGLVRDFIMTKEMLEKKKL
jgi:phosphate starvation-inducible protein PhoH and related proteins